MSTATTTVARRKSPVPSTAPTTAALSQPGSLSEPEARPVSLGSLGAASSKPLEAAGALGSRVRSGSPGAGDVLRSQSPASRAK